MKFNIKAFALTCGLFWGIALFCITWWVILWEGSSTEVTFIGRVYLGYDVTPLGSVIGLLWGFIDGLIVGAIFSWAYNRLSQRLA